MDKKRIAVLFGGASSEHEVSLLSASSVVRKIPKDKYDVVTVGITKDGRWYYYAGSMDKLPDSQWEKDESLIPAVLSPDTACHGLLLLKENGVEEIYLDAVFPVLHGKNGEDGTVQGLLQMAGIPFVGCDSVSSGICMDKALTNTIADSAGIPQARWLGITAFDYAKNKDTILAQAGEYLGFPVFVKPANAGSSVGVSKAKNLKELDEGIFAAFVHDRKVVLEEAVDGIEVECAVLGNEEPIASVPGEIVPCNDFYDFDAKYLAGTSELHIPARLPEDKLEEVRAEACRAYIALGCSGLARIDFFIRRSDGKVMLNEPNTIPGFTSISMYHKLFEASGIPYEELLDRLITLAFERC